MTARLSGTGELNGTAKRQSKGRKAPAAEAAAPAAGPGPGAVRARRWLTVGMGAGIPCLSLALSSIGGRLLAEGECVLGVCALSLCCAVLAVSLSHLAWAIRDVSGSEWWQAWCLAAAIDLSLVLGELSGIAGFDSWVVSAVMVSVTLCSAVLNCWAFLAEQR